MPKIGVLLSGCGVYDGSEVHEAVLTLLELDKRGCETVIVAPDKTQMHVVNHITGEVMPGEERNVLVESARIARGAITNIDALNPADLDALVLPGGFGAAKNLCDFAVAGAETSVDPAIAQLLKTVHEMGKPIAAICISPAVVAAALGKTNPELTIGNDRATAEALESMGAMHFQCPVEGFHVDEKNKLISTPAYMLGKSISDVHTGISNMADALMDMI
ncbi:MAG: isoprenoid biosynthesis glyoxalase ElbB [Holophagae bacterium]|nr:isoprenoid biosynthesis glyoxalase ElbB [Holophagae bacterium]